MSSSTPIDNEIASLRTRLAFLEEKKQALQNFDEMLVSWVPAAVARNRDSDLEKRSAEAFCSNYITMYDARNDLMTNPESPFLFRKWLVLQTEEAPEDIRMCTSLRRQEIMNDYIGTRVIALLGCKCGNNVTFRIDPTAEWCYSSGQFNIKALKGACSSWIGHTGHCWEGTMASNRTNAC